jgi:hypothetical protein
MYEGSCVLFQITLAMLKMNEAALCAADNSASVFQLLSDIPARVGVDEKAADALVDMAIRVASSVGGGMLEAARRKHQAYLMVEEGTLLSHQAYSLNPGQQLPMSRERPRLSNAFVAASEERGGGKIGSTVKRLLGRMVSSHSSDNSNELSHDDEPQQDEGSKTSTSKTKNIVQTELLVNLRRVILKLAHHFHTHDPARYSLPNSAAPTRIASSSSSSSSSVMTLNLVEQQEASSPTTISMANSGTLIEGFDEPLALPLSSAASSVVHHHNNNEDALSTTSSMAPIHHVVVNLQADYSLESHALDYQRYMMMSGNGNGNGDGKTGEQSRSGGGNVKRAKALMDFDKTDEDELGFKKNDLITVLSTKDDHCWIGYGLYTYPCTVVDI